VVSDTLLGVILGTLLGYLPRFWRVKSKAKSCKASLIGEINKCNEMANGFVSATPHVQSPSYRLPMYAWTNSFPELLGIGVMTTDNVNKLYDLYIQVDSLNRGLDQANAVMNQQELLDREDNRNCIKATNISKTFENAIQAVESIPTWLWLS
jgi:hypothetical protein